MKLSIIIPAYNESKRIEACLRSVHGAIQSHASPKVSAAEVIVVDNNSSDGTGELARHLGAQVVFEPHNQIARARNKGASVASGDWFLFLDADTLMTPGTLSELLALIEEKRCPGGASVLRFDRTPLALKPVAVAGNLLIRISHLTCGCFIFCRREVFREIGGFNEELFAAEDAVFGYELKCWAKRHRQKLALIRRHPPITSIRKLELYSAVEIAKLFVGLIFFPRRLTRDKRHLAIFYDGRR